MTHGSVWIFKVWARPGVPMKFGNLEGGFWGRYMGALGPRPHYSYIGPHRIPPQCSQVSLSTPGLFHTLDMYICIYIYIYIYRTMLISQSPSRQQTARITTLRIATHQTQYEFHESLKVFVSPYGTFSFVQWPEMGVTRSKSLHFNVLRSNLLHLSWHWP